MNMTGPAGASRMARESLDALADEYAAALPEAAASLQASFDPCRPEPSERLVEILRRRDQKPGPPGRVRGRLHRLRQHGPREPAGLAAADIGGEARLRQTNMRSFRDDEERGTGHDSSSRPPIPDRRQSCGRRSVWKTGC